MDSVTDSLSLTNVDLRVPSTFVRADIEKLLNDVWIIVPAYREAEVIGSVINSLHVYVRHVVVVNDGSPDATAAVAKAAGAEVLSHATNLGQGAAIQTGFDYALRRGAQYIMTLDADGQHRPESIPVMLEHLIDSKAEVALGSRFLGQESKSMPLSRRMLLMAASLFTRAHTRLHLTDTHNGLKLFTANAASHMKLQQPGFAHASEELQRIAELRLPFVEVPVRIDYTEYSVKKGQRSLNFVKILLEILYAGLTKKS